MNAAKRLTFLTSHLFIHDAFLLIQQQPPRHLGGLPRRCEGYGYANWVRDPECTCSQDCDGGYTSVSANNVAAKRPATVNAEVYALGPVRCAAVSQRRASALCISLCPPTILLPVRPTLISPSPSPVDRHTPPHPPPPPHYTHT